jgi:CBS domain-containing membrane protein
MSPKEPQVVADLMTRDVATLQRNDQLSIADDVMSLGRVRHLPVLGDDGELAGIISHRDLLHGALSRVLGYGSAGRAKLLKTVLVKEAMTCDPITVPPNTPIAEAARLMVDKKVGCLLVVERDELVGILTESDFVKLHAAP